MVNTSRPNIEKLTNNIDKFTLNCEKPINVLIYGDEICKKQYGDQWKYVSIDRTNCTTNKFRGICRYTPNILQENNINAINDKINDNKKLFNLMNEKKSDCQNNPDFNDHLIIKNYPIKKLSTDKLKFPLQRKLLDSKKIDLSETDISTYIDQESSIYPIEQFNDTNYMCPSQNNFIYIIIFILCISFLILIYMRLNIERS